MHNHTPLPKQISHIDTLARTHGHTHTHTHTHAYMDIARHLAVAMGGVPVISRHHFLAVHRRLITHMMTFHGRFLCLALSLSVFLSALLGRRQPLPNSCHYSRLSRAPTCDSHAYVGACPLADEASRGTSQSDKPFTCLLSFRLSLPTSALFLRPFSLKEHVLTLFSEVHADFYLYISIYTIVRERFLPAPTIS